MILIVLAMLLSNPDVHASGEKHNGDQHVEQHVELHDENDRFGKAKAILDYEAEKGFRLSEKSIERLGIQFSTMKSLNFRIPKSAFTFREDTKGFFILKNKYFKFVEIEDEKTLKAEDRIVVQGAGLIAITDVFTRDQSEYGHSH